MGLAEVTSIAWITVTGEGILSVYTFATLAWRRLAIIYICLTIHTRKTRRTLARISSDGVLADSPILARVGSAVIYVDLTAVSSEPDSTVASEVVFLVGTNSPIETGIHSTFIYVYLTLCTSKSGHANTSKSSGVIKTRTLVLTGMGLAFIDVGLAAGASETLGAVTGETSRCVYTNSVMFTRRTLLTLIDILRTVNALVSRGAGAGIAAIDGARIADGVHVAGVGGARVLQVTQQPSLAGSAATVEAAHAVNASGSIETGCPGAVINVGTAIWAGPPVHANARESTYSIGTSGTILTHARSMAAFIHILFT